MSEPATTASEPAQKAPRRALLPLGAVLLAYLCLATAYNAVTRLNYAPDEPWHYRYVESIALRGKLPSLSETHQAQHPPLYYALAAAWYRLGALALRGDSLERWVRLLSTLLSLGTLLLVFTLARRFLADGALPQTATVATVALLPLFTYMSAVVNNDALNILLFTATLLVLVRGCLEGFTVKRAAWLGGLSGLGLLTKESGLAAVPVCLIVIVWDARARGATYSTVAKQLAAYLGAALLVCGWWFARNQRLFGSFFIHATAREPQASAVDVLAAFMRQPSLLTRILRHTFNRSLMSFFAPLWIVRAFVPPSMWLRSLAVWVGIVVVGLVLARARRAAPPSAEQGRAGWALALAAVMLTLGILRYVLFVDYTAMEGGRYMLPAVGAIALATVAGLGGWAGRSNSARNVLWGLLIALLLVADLAFLRVTHLFYSLGIG